MMGWRREDQPVARVPPEGLVLVTQDHWGTSFATESVDAPKEFISPLQWDRFVEDQIPNSREATYEEERELAWAFTNSRYVRLVPLEENAFAVVVKRMLATEPPKRLR